ncbi:hypothetical protein GCM10010254_12350 [Streptomyces chromofuscus]|nr:hypothetical protein GCM10010254_12350 [Streptomyces chromofuscus]
MSMGPADNGFETFDGRFAMIRTGCPQVDAPEEVVPHRTFTATTMNVTDQKLNLPASWTTATRADGT